MNKTYKNTTFAAWYKKACVEFAKLNLRTPCPTAAKSAYEVGETPLTWARYLAFA